MYLYSRVFFLTFLIYVREVFWYQVFVNRLWFVAMVRSYTGVFRLVLHGGGGGGGLFL